MTILPTQGLLPGLALLAENSARNLEPLLQPIPVPNQRQMGCPPIHRERQKKPRGCSETSIHGLHCFTVCYFCGKEPAFARLGFSGT